MFVLAALWAGWHLPAFFDPASSQSMLPPAAWLLGVVGISYALTWLFNATRSVPVAAVFHATFNVAGLWVLSGLPADATGAYYWVGVALFAVLAAALVVSTRAGLRFVPASTVPTDAP
jgi:membrane protease YdiL (CAAX protease family)